MPELNSVGEACVNHFPDIRLYVCWQACNVSLHISATQNLAEFRRHVFFIFFRREEVEEGLGGWGEGESMKQLEIVIVSWLLKIQQLTKYISQRQRKNTHTGW